MGGKAATREQGFVMSMKAKITTPLNPRTSLPLYPSPPKTEKISGDQLLRLKGSRGKNKLYEKIALEINECSGAEAGTLQVTVIFERSIRIVSLLGWKTKYSDITIGNDMFRVEMV